MTGEPDNLVLVYLRRIDEKVDRLIDDVNDLKARVFAVEENLAGIDRLELRVERIERRLDLADATH